MRAQTLSLLSALVIVGCSSTPSSSPSSTRAVTGTLSARSYALDNPVVLAESSDNRLFVATLTADGHFQLNLPPNVAYRLTLANSTATPGVYAAVARVNWPLETGPGRWAVLGDGATLDLGTVYRRASGPDGRRISSDDGGGGGGGSCKEQDDAKCSHDHEDDCDCDHKYSDDDHCDKDDHGDEHDHDCDHEHGYGDVDGGCTCGGYGDGHDGEHDDGYGSGGRSGHGACDGGAPATPPSNGCSCGAGGSGGAGGGGAGGTGGSGGSGGAGGGANGSPCNVNADCASGACISSVCAPPSTQIP
jgi:hypothetical protein